MSKLTRFFGACLLVVSLSALTLADGEGGQLQSPPAPIPAPSVEFVIDSNEATSSIQTNQNSWVDFAAETCAIWLVASMQ
jgi:hypothetical protein